MYAKKHFLESNSNRTNWRCTRFNQSFKDFFSQVKVHLRLTLVCPCNLYASSFAKVKQWMEILQLEKKICIHSGFLK